ncbi:MAG: hypothetical protein A2504_00795 [Bdellovibrionales bacterium RIFOXYD12_FULL_39_22]|nr:MAG: hypothetical protein A2385_03415 [Bdellovibrionales bacterium RIFOXYB1_FULL_39_21]OFZ42624.1 MAG: hypothetical protein A2485_09890 [Bdellovibrionales bacterium RIFOXYC12_FULL_39_17]OFZ47108.1 MAG: hypothetical protein A2404_15405 [Bdellovibrionales bacterium RIFOXYC1_FULL_39_130]OFZ75356.1 MAG: hypothetical protein A2560_14180 [Bdellovibrionales bacterium RIFOXYD1_FULL_39_84]OFZ93307.1 MAG: hypothetical protein A2504_00795 [Bdellovibrionales bacterium RIFOXYD12_FULL_39_22]HLE10017.1 tw
MFGLGTGELVLIGAIIFLLFGAKKLPALGGALAKSIKNFQEGMKGGGAGGDSAISEDKDKKES